MLMVKFEKCKKNGKTAKKAEYRTQKTGYRR
jgi:hypothetical protein